MKFIVSILVFATCFSASADSNYPYGKGPVSGGYTQPPQKLPPVYVQPAPYNPGNNYPPGYQPPQQNQNDWIYNEAYKATNGQCNIKQNPHSYACTVWNFNNNPVFPLFTMDWYGVLQGEWFTVTYVSAQHGNNGPAFYMAKNPQKPTIPLGVYNVNTNSPVGKMWIQNHQWVMENWLGQKNVWSHPDPASTYMDQFSFQFQMVTQDAPGQYFVHLFTCRDFNRNNTHHLLCKWDVWYQNGGWVEQGYFGFLTGAVWNKFISGGH